jgi:hypothetical protein
MPDWQERITRDTAPAIRVEHELRYAAAAPFVHASAAWCDLGCGTGLGAAAGLGRPFDGTALLVDVDEHAVAEAERAIAAASTIPLTADLTDPQDLARLRERLLEASPDGRRCITCFEVVEHLSTFVPLIELLIELASEHDTTVVASVPNDAFWAIANPHHVTTWGERPVEELRGLLPADHVIANQVALQGAALVREGEQREDVASVTVSDVGIPTHFLIAFGPGAAEIATGPRVVQADLEEQRRWERQRDSDLRYTQDAWQLLKEQYEKVDRLNARLRTLERRSRLRSLARRLLRRSGGGDGTPPSA